MDHLCFSVLCLLCLCAGLFICALRSPAGICAGLFICALRSPAGKGLTSWLSFMVSNCEFVSFLLVL